MTEQSIGSDFFDYMVHTRTIAIRWVRSTVDLVTLERGVIWTPPDGPLGGAIYCVGAGTMTSETNDAGGMTYRYSLRQFSKLGTCAKGSGTPASLSGCIRRE